MSPNLVLVAGNSDPGRRSLREPGALIVHADRRTLARDGAVVRVPRAVFAFVVAVTAHPGAVLSSAELLDLVQGAAPAGRPDAAAAAIDVLALRARPALAALGYRLEIEPSRGRFARCCLSPHPVTYGELAADQELSRAQA